MTSPHPNPSRRTPAGLPKGEGARVVVITGANGALGNKAAQSFAARGHSLVLVGTDQNKLDSLARELNLPDDRLLTIVADLRDRKAVHSAAEAVSAKFGRVDALLHLVGGWVGGKTLSEASAEDLESMLGQHVWTTFHLFQSFGPKLESNGWGRVMIVS
ncbi:MAG TPA: SDR family oxidoreductase, partial [Anaerolineales bacterium]|nr:SDR family oxidoreductase [Anaerolineales bacterium]